MPPRPYTLEPSGLVLAVRLTPGAKRAGIEGVERAADGTARLRVRVAAPAVEGKANAALIALLAEAGGVPRSRVSIAAGAAGRTKRIRIEGGDAAMARRLCGSEDEAA
jgi:uncharacterized protein